MHKRNQVKVNAAASSPSKINSKGETEKERQDRRSRESDEVEKRVETITTVEELKSAMSNAGKDLVVLEIESDTACEIKHMDAVNPAYFDQPEDVLYEPCTNLKHSFQRVARNCPDVTFLSFIGDANDTTKTYTEETLGVSTFPTLQFYKHRKLLWQHEGVDDALRDLDQGILFYRDGDEVDNYVSEIRSKSDFEAAVCESEKSNELLVIDVSSASATPCLNIFPAVVSLARAFQGVVKFARIIVDLNAETASIFKELDIDEVPTFVFYFQGEERHRFTSSSRGDLIGQLLEQQEQIGYKLPAPKKKMSKKKK